MTEEELIIEQTKKWINQVVIGCNFCPFAAKEMKRKSVRFSVLDSIGLEEALIGLLVECRKLDAEPGLATTLVIFSRGFPVFDDYLRLVEYAEALLELEHYTGIYQIASFHPDYRFEDAPDNDPADFTNKSLYPMLHLLREEDMEKALEQYPDPAGIPVRNMRFARQKGLAFMENLRNSCWDIP
jgi:hypothetical protein